MEDREAYAMLKTMGSEYGASGDLLSAERGVYCRCHTLGVKLRQSLEVFGDWSVEWPDGSRIDTLSLWVVRHLLDALENDRRVYGEHQKIVLDTPCVPVL